MLRVFLTSSHLSTVLMATYARTTWQPGYTDILLLDSTPRKESLIKLIMATSHIHPWHNIYSFSQPMSDERNMKPTLYQTVMRKLKTKPVIKPLYDMLYKRHMHSRLSGLTQTIKDTLKEKSQDYKDVTLHLLTETMLNKPLMEVFPGAGICYFEHGQGDYYYMLKKQLKGSFHCIFAAEYKAFLEKRGIGTGWVKELFPPGEFERSSKKFLEQFPAQSEMIRGICNTDGTYALILLDAVDIYNVPSSFWQALAEKCIRKISEPGKVKFIIKPHPAQSKESINAIKSYFTAAGLQFSMLEQVELANMSVEVMYSLWKNKIKYVFSLFSTSIYYLSALYPSDTTTYYYSYKFMREHIGNAPWQYKNLFLELEDLTSEVFTTRCKEF